MAIIIAPLWMQTAPMSISLARSNPDEIQLGRVQVAAERFRFLHPRSEKCETRAYKS